MHPLLIGIWESLYVSVMLDPQKFERQAQISHLKVEEEKRNKLSKTIAKSW